MRAERSARGPDATLGWYGRFLRRHLVLVLAMGLLGGGLSIVAIARSTLVYRSTVAVVVSIVPTSFTDDTAPRRRGVSVDSDAQVAASTRVSRAAADAVGFPGGYAALSEALTITAVPNSRMLLLRVTAGTAPMARDGAAAVADKFLGVRRATIERRLGEEETSLQGQITAVNARLTALRRAGPADPSGSTALVLEERDLTQKLAALEGRLARAIATPVDPGFVAQPPPYPQSGVRLNVPGSLVSGLLLGLLVGLLIGAGLDTWRPGARLRAAGAPGEPPLPRELASGRPPPRAPRPVPAGPLLRTQGDAPR